MPAARAGGFGVHLPFAETSTFRPLQAVVSVMGIALDGFVAHC
jgi:hypothetical protein